MPSSSAEERAFSAALRARGFRFETNDRQLPGTPDLVFRSCRVVAFVHGCFWHPHHDCPPSQSPKGSVSKWTAILNRAVTRDQEAAIELAVLGWTRVVIWTCEIKRDLNMCLQRVAAAVEAASW